MPLKTPETPAKTLCEIAQEENRKLVAKIESAYRLAFDLAATSRERAEDAIKAAVRVGTMLNIVREKVGWGNWTQRLTENCPDVCHRTADNWMALASRSAGGLITANSLIGAYRVTGILPDKSKRPRAKKANLARNSNFLQDIHRLYASKNVELMLMTKDFSHAKSPDLAVWLHELPPLVELYDRIKAALAAAP